MSDVGVSQWPPKCRECGGEVKAMRFSRFAYGACLVCGEDWESDELDAGCRRVKVTILDRDSGETLCYADLTNIRVPEWSNRAEKFEAMHGVLTHLTDTLKYAVDEGLVEEDDE